MAINNSARSIRRSIVAAVLAANVVPAMALLYALFVTDRYKVVSPEKDIGMVPISLLYEYILFAFCFGFVFAAAKLLGVKSAKYLVALSLVPGLVLVSLFYFAMMPPEIPLSADVFDWVVVTPFVLVTFAGIASLYCYVARIPFRST